MTMIRKTLLAFFLLSVVVAVGVATAAPDAATKGSSGTPTDLPMAVFPETRFDFQSVMEGTEIKHDFVIENHGTAPLIIKNVRPD